MQLLTRDNSSAGYCYLPERQDRACGSGGRVRPCHCAHVLAAIRVAGNYGGAACDTWSAGVLPAGAAVLAAFHSDGYCVLFYHADKERRAKHIF